MKLNGGANVDDKKPVQKAKKSTPVIEEEDDDFSDIAPDDDDDLPFDTEEPEVEEPVMIKLSKTRLNTIREVFSKADANTKKEVKKYLTNYGNKLADEMLESDVISIETLLHI